MSTKAVQEQFLNSAVGRRLDPDLSYGLQCVDLPDAYAEAIFGVDWRTSVGGVEGAKELLTKAPDKFWEKIYNDPANPDQLPERGDVLVYGGNAANRYGHTAVTLSATGEGAHVIQQDGAHPNQKWIPDYPGAATGGMYSDEPVREGNLGWYLEGAGWITGWLRPRPEKVIDVNETSPVVSSDYQFLTQYDFPAHTPRARVRATFGVDRPDIPVSDVIHWWGDPANRPTFEGTITHFLNQPPTGVSSNYVTEAGRVACGVAEGDASHANGHAAANAMTVTWECNPRMSQGDIDTLVDALSDAWINRGLTSPGLIEEHNDYHNTQCPGTYKAEHLQSLANALFAQKLAAKQGNPLPEAPKPVPVDKPAPVVPPAPGFILDPHWNVERGDTLSKIAVWAGVTWQRLAEFNGIKSPNAIEVGDVIWAPRDGIDTWEVEKGDTLSKVAAYYNKLGHHDVTVATLQNANGINDPKKDVKIGMRLLVRG